MDGAVHLNGSWIGNGTAATRRIVAALHIALVFALWLGSPTVGAVSKVDPGEVPRLEPDEGFLVVNVDTTSRISSVRIQKLGSVLAAAVLPHIDIGRTQQVFVVEAGEYAWDELDLTTNVMRARYLLGKDAEYHFRVEAGQINYPGDLIVRPRTLEQTSFHLSNRALPVIDWLESQHPSLYRDYPFRYSGRYPDPFPEFYRSQRASLPDSAPDLNTGRDAPKPSALPLAPGDLWASPRVTAIAMSPNGRLVAETIEEDGLVKALHLIDLKAETSQRLGAAFFAYDDLYWKDDHTLLATGGAGKDQQHLTVFALGEMRDGKHTVQSRQLPLAAHMVDGLQGRPNTILMQRVDSRNKLIVHALDISSAAKIDAYRTTKTRDRLNRGVDNDVLWFADGNGALRMVVVRRDQDLVLMHGKGREFSPVLTLGEDDGFEPLTLSYDGNLIYGLSDHDRDQRDLVEFDPAGKRITRTVFSRPGVDVVNVIVDDRRTPVGVRYFQGGRLQSEYFAATDQGLAQLVQATFPNRTVLIADRSKDGRQLLLAVDGSDQPTLIYHLDLDQQRASLIDEMMPGLAGRRFVASQLIVAKGSDGLAIEAFLTLPPGEGKRPLVVMPHGGPIGVSDYLHFDPEVQFLASLGYAVLQVNYRGSDGYGKAFREAGYRNHGRMIEDDIDAAITTALAGFPLDSDRMCILGTSYGGYSAMVSTIRWPSRFRCAVSIAGVSDRSLFFTASDSARNARTRTRMERIIGNPNTDMDEMRATSPLYRYSELQVPIMLVHGRDDLRVDFEHTRRMVRTLNLAGRPPVLMAFSGEGHGLQRFDHLVLAWTGIAGFLGEHLGAPVPVPSAGVETPATPDEPGQP